MKLSPFEEHRQEMGSNSFICKASEGVGGSKRAALPPQQSRDESATKALPAVVHTPPTYLGLLLSVSSGFAPEDKWFWIGLGFGVKSVKFSVPLLLLG